MSRRHDGYYEMTEPNESEAAVVVTEEMIDAGLAEHMCSQAGCHAPIHRNEIQAIYRAMRALEPASLIDAASARGPVSEEARLAMVEGQRRRREREKRG